MITREVDLGAVILRIRIGDKEEFMNNSNHYFKEMIEVIKAMEFLDDRGITIYE
ncbi:hypothetical protein HUC00_28670 [Bacillus mycoides]|nr:hypothetical protein [Bacillus mycoides]